MGSLRQELRAGQEEAAAWQRRCKQVQGEADGRELELARRDLHAKVGGWALDASLDWLLGVHSHVEATALLACEFCCCVAASRRATLLPCPALLLCRSWRMRCTC